MSGTNDTSNTPTEQPAALFPADEGLSREILNEVDERGPMSAANNDDVDFVYKILLRTFQISTPTYRDRVYDRIQSELEWTKPQLSRNIQFAKSKSSEFLQSSNPNFIEFPDMRDDGVPILTVENVVALLAHHKIECSYDVYLKEPKITIPGYNPPVSGGQLEAQLTEIESRAARAGFKVNPNNITKVVQGICYNNGQWPIMMYLMGLVISRDKWQEGQNTDYLQLLAETLQVAPGQEEARNAAVRRWMLQCVAAAYAGQDTRNPLAIPKYEYVLTLQGHQGLQKTQWFRSLVPEEFRSGYFKDGVHLDPTNKDSIIKATAHWVTELGEFDATMKASKAAQLKSFLSEEWDQYRPPYGRTAGNWTRTTSFCATVNKSMYLTDQTGNRRILPISPTRVTLPQHAGLSLRDVWWQATSMYEAGDQWWLTPAEERLLEESRAAALEQEDAHIQDLILRKFVDFTHERKCMEGAGRMTRGDIAENIGLSRADTPDLLAIERVLDRLNRTTGNLPDFRYSGGQRLWKMPPLISPGECDSRSVKRYLQDQEERQQDLDEMRHDKWVDSLSDEDYEMFLG